MLDLSEFSELDPMLKISIIVSIVLLLALVLSIVIAYIVMRKKNSAAFTTRDITFGAICLAISFALGFIGIKLPQGGTITPASSLAIMIYCYFFGFRKGSVVCFAYMLLQFLQSPYIVHPMSAVLDYVIPYLALIFFGVFSARRFKTAASTENTNPIKNNVNFLIGAFAYIIIRYFSHVISGVIFYAEWAWEGWGVVAYSFAYNSFFLIDAFIAVSAGIAIFSSRAFMHYMLPQSKNEKIKIKI